MPNPAVEYEVIGVAPGGRTLRWKRKGAPDETWMIQRGKRHHCKAVIRYFPSKRGWRVLDIRNAIELVAGTNMSRRWFKGQVRGSIYFPNEDAAVMAAIHLMD